MGIINLGNSGINIMLACLKNSRLPKTKQNNCKINTK